MADTSDVVTIAKGFLPSGSTVYTIIIWFIAILFIGGIIALCVWLFIDRRRYNRIIPMYEEQNGILRKIGQDKARVILIDKGLARVWRLKKLKMYCEPMIYSSDKLTYPAIRKSDGDLLNFQLKIDEEGRIAVAKIMPQGIRMANANIRRYFREIYKKEGFWDKHGDKIMRIAEMVIYAMILIYILSEVAKLTPQLNAIADKLAEALSNVHCTAVPAGQVVTGT